MMVSNKWLLMSLIRTLGVCVVCVCLSSILVCVCPKAVWLVA